MSALVITAWKFGNHGSIVIYSIKKKHALQSLILPTFPPFQIDLILHQNRITKSQAETASDTNFELSVLLSLHGAVVVVLFIPTSVARLKSSSRVKARTPVRARGSKATQRQR